MTLNKCEFSSLAVPNNRAYIGVAREYVGEVAKKLGFEEKDRLMIENVVAEIVSNVIEDAFEPDERAAVEISCERVPLGMKVVIADQGSPFDPSRISTADTREEPEQGSEKGLRISSIKESVDELEFHNLGPRGKETVLIKYLKNRSVADYFDACELDPYLQPSLDRTQVSKPVEVTIRPMEPSEALEVSKCVYKAYGNTYAFEHMYYPDRLLELNLSGQVFSVVAVTSQNEIVGHLALTKHSEDARIAEIGRAVVKPEFRSGGIFTRLTRFVLENARSEGLIGIFGQAVTNHTYSQQVGLGVGLRDCALFVGYLPQTESFRKITEKLQQRESVLVHFMYLHKPPLQTIYPPPNHRKMIESLYLGLGASPQSREPEEPHESAMHEKSAVRISASGPSGTARILVERLGADVFEEVKLRWKELCLKRVEIIHLYLDLSNRQIAYFVPHFEKLGFFFAGILPGTEAGDALILQYLNNVPIDYEKIHAKSEKAHELLDYVRRLDPNQL